MSTVVTFPTTLRSEIRRLATTNASVRISIRFARHRSRRDLEKNRWNIQGTILRQAGRKATKGFTKQLAASGNWFKLRIRSRRVWRFTVEMLPYVDKRFVVVKVNGQRLTPVGLRIPRRA
jgi:hypothetical protein